MAFLADYLINNDTTADEPAQKAWYEKLNTRVKEGHVHFESLDEFERAMYHKVFSSWVRTEELKAWYGEPENGSLFQGTSVSSLTIPCNLPEPIELNSVTDLVSSIADQYIVHHDRIEPTVKEAIGEDTTRWRKEGLFYGVVIASKILSQAFRLTVPAKDVVFPVDGILVDPHEITSYPIEIRTAYFEQCRQRINCLQEIPNLSVSEFESSLVLADISKPKLARYVNQLMLAPVRVNEICALLSNDVTEVIRERTHGRINPRSLMVTVYDTDTPYTYHQITGHFGRETAPNLPGLAVLGTSGTIDAFRWLYAYRVSLISQKLMKSSLYSQVASKFVPFVFMGVLVERDAEILLDLDNLGRLRYRGNLSPHIEFCYAVPKIRDHLAASRAFDPELDLASRLH